MASGIFARSVIALVAGLAATSAVLADATSEKFYRAYYLEQEQGDYAAAAKLYAEVASASSADAELKSRAKARLAACTEEESTGDFAALMPTEALAYVELNQPGQRIIGLLRGLGLINDAEDATEAGGRRFAISPALIKELLGIRGVAAAVTGFDPIAGMPSGVAVFHPGDVDVIRGAIETLLPATARPAKAIGGFATYDVEGMVLVTLTHRLVIVSQQASEIESVIRRMKGDEKESFATNPALTEMLKDRGDALVYFCVNARPIMPLVNAALAAAGSESSEMALAQAVLDLNSLQAVSGQLGVGEQGIRLDLSLRLAEGHQNLVYNFLRMPPLDRDMLKCIPVGAAGFAAFSLNHPSSRFNGDATAAREERVVVTAMDIGREVFGNIVSFGAFVLPTTGGAVDGVPIPDMAAVMTVNDPAKSAALWGQLLGLASLATGGGGIEGTTSELEGAKVRSFPMPEGVTLMLAVAGNDVLISPSRAAISRALAAKRGGDTILDDPAFRNGLDRLGPDATVAIFAHAGRCFELARPHLDDDELSEMAPFIERLDKTVGSLVVTHSDQLYRLSLMVTGLPKVDDLVTQLIENGEIRSTQRALADRHVAAVREEARLVADATRAEAQAINAAAEAEREAVSAHKQREDDSESESSAVKPTEPSDARSLGQRFEQLATRADDERAAREVAERLIAALDDDAQTLNEIAWRLLTEEKYGGRFNDVAQRMAKRCNELTSHENWMFVDTLAWAHFKDGNVNEAIKLEKQALKLCKDSRRIGEVKQALKKFELALEQDAEPASSPPDLR